MLEHGAASATVLADSGRALAALHQRSVAGLPVHAPGAAAAAVRAAAQQVGVVLPELARAATQLGNDVAGRLARLPVEPAVVVHGDFSTDQVVVTGTDSADRRDRVALLDLDRAAQGDAATDLASLFAALVAGDVIRGGRGGPPPHEVLQRVREGYVTERSVPAPEAVTVHAAALLLRRVVEPFRQCAPQWTRRASALFDAAVEVGTLGVEAPLTLRAGPPPMGPRARAGPTDVDPLAVSPADLLANLLGEPLTVELLKDKPGRRRTSRATGPAGTAIVKVYASDRAPVVAARVGAVHHKAAEPVLPRVLLCDEARHFVVLTDVPGVPYSEALLAGDQAASARVGRALGAWHAAHRGRVPAELRAHTVDREIATLLQRAASAPAAIGDAVRRAVPSLSEPWKAVTVVHRDLYEKQIVLGGRVGLLDLDDAAAGPAELDLGNLLAHLRLLSRRSGLDLTGAVATLLAGYADVAPVDSPLLRRCEALSRLRLACLHRDESLLDAAGDLFIGM